jgi:hypothetical protein
MADYSPIYTGGVEPFTATSSGAVTGGNVVVWSGVNTVAAAGADSAAVAGVAAHDAAASGVKLTIWPIEGCVHELVATAAITALAGVVTDATAGQVKTATIATAAAAGTPDRNRGDHGRRVAAEAPCAGTPVGLPLRAAIGQSGQGVDKGRGWATTKCRLPWARQASVGADGVVGCGRGRCGWPARRVALGRPQA